MTTQRATPRPLCGVRLVWIVWPERRAVDLWTPGVQEPHTLHTLPGDDTLDGGDIVPGFLIAHQRELVTGAGRAHLADLPCLSRADRPGRCALELPDADGGAPPGVYTGWPGRAGQW